MVHKPKFNDKIEHLKFILYKEEGLEKIKEGEKLKNNIYIQRNNLASIDEGEVI